MKKINRNIGFIKHENNEIRSYISYTIANNYIEYCIVSIIQYKMGS